MSATRLTLEELCLNGGTQPREEINDDAVDEYAEFLTQNPERDMPPILVVRCDLLVWPFDGFHRIYAYRKAGRLSIPAEVRKGTLQDAQLLSFGANQSHGLRRTNETKRQAVLGTLKHPEGSKWSDRRIADHCGVSGPFVASIRTQVQTVCTSPQVVTVTTSPKPAPTRQGKDGKNHPAPPPRTPARSTGDRTRDAAAERIARQQRATPAEAALAATDQHDEADVTPHRCPSCGYKWEGMNEPPMLPKDPLPDFPSGLDTEPFRSAWTDWMAYRKERRLASYKPKGFAGQMKQLMAMGVDRAIAAIEFSIAQNYQGIFDPHKNGKGKAAPEQFSTIKEWLEEAQNGVG